MRLVDGPEEHAWHDVVVDARVGEGVNRPS